MASVASPSPGDSRPPRRHIIDTMSDFPGFPPTGGFAPSGGPLPFTGPPPPGLPYPPGLPLPGAPGPEQAVPVSTDEKPLPAPPAPSPEHAVPASTEEAPQPTPESPRLEKSVPVPPRTEPLPIPTSNFSTYRRFQPRCGHLSMTRVYDLNMRCERCGRHGAFGWLYRCTEHREPLIDDLNRLHMKTAWDPLGEHFAPLMSLGKHGPDKRYDKFSVIREMTTEQLHTYTPAQLLKILEQRENVWKTAEKDMSTHTNRLQLQGLSFDPTPNSRIMPMTQLMGSLWDNMPGMRHWVPARNEECKFTVCPACYKGAKDKAWVSLDGVVNGDIPPTVATAFSFVYMKERPVCNAEVVKNLGYRAVPLPRFHLAYPRGDFVDLDDEDSITLPSSIIPYSIPVIEYKPGDAYNPDADPDWETVSDDASEPSISAHDYEIAEDDISIHNLPRGRTLRRTSPLTILRGLHVSSTGSNTHFLPIEVDAPLPVELLPAYFTGCLPEDESPEIRQSHRRAFYYDMDYFSGLAARVPVPDLDIDEELWMLDEALGSMDIADEGLDYNEFDDRYNDHHFGSEAPYVPDGIAVREEAEEGGLADLVTQV